MNLLDYTGTWKDQFGNILVIDAINDGTLSGKYKANDGHEEIQPITGYWNEGAEFPTIGFIVMPHHNEEDGIKKSDRGSLCTKWGLKKIPVNR